MPGVAFLGGCYNVEVGGLNIVHTLPYDTGQIGGSGFLRSEAEIGVYLL